MKDINFLPQSFVHRQRKRRDRIFYATVGASAIGVVLSIALVMLSIRQAVIHQSRSLDDDLATARQRQAEFANLQLELKAQRERAALLAYLEQEWPLSRMLSEIAEPIPSQISLLKLSYNRDAGQATRPAGNPFDKANQQQEEAPMSPFAADLKELREQVESNPWVITVEGETSDAAVLHLFVDKLSSSPLFSNVALEGFRAGNNTLLATRQFTLQLSVAPGHGETNGRRAPKTQGHVAMAEVPRGN